MMPKLYNNHLILRLMSNRTVRSHIARNGNMDMLETQYLIGSDLWGICFDALLVNHQRIV